MRLAVVNQARRRRQHDTVTNSPPSRAEYASTKTRCTPVFKMRASNKASSPTEAQRVQASSDYSVIARGILLDWVPKHGRHDNSTTKPPPTEDTRQLASRCPVTEKSSRQPFVKTPRALSLARHHAEGLRTSFTTEVGSRFVSRAVAATPSWLSPREPSPPKHTSPACRYLARIRRVYGTHSFVGVG